MFRVFFTSKRSFGGLFQSNGCIHFHMMRSWAGCNNLKWIRDTPIFLVALFPFLPQKSCLKSSILRVFLFLKKTFVATFNETGAPTFRKYTAKQGIMMPNLWQAFQFFCSHSSAFALEKQSKNLNFRFLSLEKTFVTTFNETGAATSRKYAAEQGIMMVKNIKTFYFWRYRSKSKKEECEQRELKISDQFEILICCSTICFLGIKVWI